MTKQQLYADLPAELAEADELLKRYGRWARGGSGPQGCGSAERAYRAPQDDEDRQPTEPTMPANDVERVRKALGTLPMMTLTAIQWLYVRPATMPGLMRKHGIQPRHMRERHLQGVGQFWRAWVGFAPITISTIAIRSVVIENLATEH
ncbi:hypothetical protein [Roseateles sp. P5_E11]